MDSMVVREKQRARLDIRLSAEDRRFLEERLRVRGQSFSDWVRTKIDEERAGRGLEERIRAVQELARMNIDWIPEDPAELERMINEPDSPAEPL
jgi:uncharacterized protein (DUF1778 family)